MAETLKPFPVKFQTAQKTRTRFAEKTVAVAAGINTEANFEGHFITFVSVTGTVKMSLDGHSEWITVRPGMELEFADREVFKKVFFTSTAGGSVTFYFGIGRLSLGGSSSGGSGDSQLVTYSAGVPADPGDTALPALAYDPDGILPIMVWNTATLSWV